MKILFLTEWFYPEPDIKGLAFAKELQQRGHKVQVLTGFPNYPGGKLYDGYKVKLFQREIIEDVEVIRVPLYPSHNQKAIHRILTYISFAFAAAFIGVFKVKKADVMYVYHPPATIAFPALFIKFFRRIPVVYDTQDIWPDSLFHSGMVRKEHFMVKAMAFFGKISYKLVDQMVVLSEGFKSLLIERGAKAEKIKVIRNWSNDIPLSHFTEQQIAEKRKELGFDQQFTVLYAGNMGPGQNVSKLLEAAEMLQTEGAKVQFAFIGGGLEVDKLKKMKEDLQLYNVSFLPRVSPNDIGIYLLAADALLVHLKRDPLSDITIPSKIQAYLMVGKPILVGVFGEAVKLVESAKAGFGFVPEDCNSFIEALKKILILSKAEREEMGANGRKFYKEELSLEKGTDTFMELFEKVAAQKNK